MGRQRGHSYCQTNCLLERYAVYCVRVADPSEEPTAFISTAVLRPSRSSLQTKAASSSDKPATYQHTRRPCCSRLHTHQYRCESHKLLRTHCWVTCVCTLTQMQVSTLLAPRDEVWTVEEMCLISSPYFKPQLLKRWLGRKVHKGVGVILCSLLRPTEPIFVQSFQDGNFKQRKISVSRWD
jgi:hypothetical protein